MRWRKTRVMRKKMFREGMSAITLRVMKKEIMAKKTLLRAPVIPAQNAEKKVPPS